MNIRILAAALFAAVLALGVAVAPAQARQSCTVGLGGVCGAYSYSGITWSNGFNTYVEDQDVGCGGSTATCNDQLTAASPGGWSVTTAMAAPASVCTQVRTYPNIQQLTQNPDGTDISLGSYKSLTSTFSITSPQVGSYEAAWDIWSTTEVMVWVDTQHHDHGGTLIGTPAIYQTPPVHIYANGPKPSPGEIIVKYDTNVTSGTVHLKSILSWLAKHGWLAANPRIGQLNFGWEVCGTDGTPQTFTVNSYTLTGGK